MKMTTMFGIRNWTSRWVFSEVVILVGITMVAQKSSATPQQSAKCYTKTSTMKVSSGEQTCNVVYDIEGCVEKHPNLPYMNVDRIQLSEEHVLETGSSLYNISMSPECSGPVLLAISSDIHGKKRCVYACFRHVIVRSSEDASSTEGVTLNLDFLKLPDGVYNITGYGGHHRIRDSGSELTSSKGRNKGEGFGFKKRGTMCFGGTDYYPKRIVHRNFIVGLREKRDLRELSEKNVIDKDPEECSCNDCIRSSHEYFGDSGLLRFYYNLTDDSCSNFTVRLMEYVGAHISVGKECLALDTTSFDVLKDMTIIGKPRSAYKIPIDFPNTPTGCYLIRTFRGVFYGFFWLESKNLTEMNTWNTTILLIPRNFDSSLEVSWASPEFPFNFTSWQLSLWYSKDVGVQCGGKDSESRIVDTIEPDKILRTSSYTFTNMSKGFYCARIYPIDTRCPSDGCNPRSSKTVHLEGTIEHYENEETLPMWIIYVLLLVGIVVGVSFAFFCYTFCRKTSPRSVYSSDEITPFLSTDPLHVLVIWTRLYTEKNPEFEMVISAFKNLLRNYSICKVFDYLDFASMDWRDRQSLLTNPTEWLHSRLNDPKGKIIFIGSQGTPETNHDLNHKTEKAHCNGFLQKHPESHEDSLDALLYPYVLRYLKESHKLSSDYGRIFYIRFPGLYSHENELEDIVPWMRFSIPNHLRSLTMKLRRVSEDSSSGFPYPCEKQIMNLQTLVNNCKANKITNNV